MLCVWGGEDGWVRRGKGRKGKAGKAPSTLRVSRKQQLASTINPNQQTYGNVAMAGTNSMGATVLAGGNRQTVEVFEAWNKKGEGGGGEEGGLRDSFSGELEVCCVKCTWFLK